MIELGNVVAYEKLEEFANSSNMDTFEANREDSIGQSIIMLHDENKDLTYLFVLDGFNPRNGGLYKLVNIA